MTLEKRLEDLSESGDRELAERLARGALQSATPTDITATNDTLIIETERFVGEHPIVREDEDITFKAGTYELKEADTPMTFTRNQVPSKAESEAKARAEEAVDEESTEDTPTLKPF